MLHNWTLFWSHAKKMPQGVVLLYLTKESQAQNAPWGRCQPPGSSTKKSLGDAARVSLLLAIRSDFSNCFLKSLFVAGFPRFRTTRFLYENIIYQPIP